MTVRTAWQIAEGEFGVDLPHSELVAVGVVLVEQGLQVVEDALAVASPEQIATGQASPLRCFELLDGDGFEALALVVGPWFRRVWLLGGLLEELLEDLVDQRAFVCGRDLPARRGARLALRCVGRGRGSSDRGRRPVLERAGRVGASGCVGAAGGDPSVPAGERGAMAFLALRESACEGGNVLAQVVLLGLTGLADAAEVEFLRVGGHVG